MTDSAQRREVTALSAALQLVTVRSRTHAKERAPAADLHADLGWLDVG